MNPVAGFEGEAISQKAGRACAGQRTSTAADNPLLEDRSGSSTSAELSFRSNWRAQLDSLIYGADAADAVGEGATATNAGAGAVRTGSSERTTLSGPTSENVIRHKRSPRSEDLHSSSYKSVGADSLSGVVSGSGMQGQVLQSIESGSTQKLTSSDVSRETDEPSAGDSISSALGREHGKLSSVEPVQAPLPPRLTGSGIRDNAASASEQAAPGAMSQGIRSESFAEITKSDSKAERVMAQINKSGDGDATGMSPFGGGDSAEATDIVSALSSSGLSMSSSQQDLSSSADVPEPLKSVSALHKNTSMRTETREAGDPLRDVDLTAAKPASVGSQNSASYVEGRKESPRHAMASNIPEAGRNSETSAAEIQPARPSKLCSELTAPAQIAGQLARDRKGQGAPAIDVDQIEGHAASDPSLNSSAVTEPVRDFAGPHAVTAQVSSISIPQPASSAVHETFAALDSGAPAPSAWRHLGTREAEAGYQDPTLGWVGVRAELNAGAIHATVSAATFEAAQVLGGHLSGLNSYLAENSTPVESLTLNAGHSGLAAGHDGGGGMTDGGNQSQHGRSQTESLTPIAMVEASSSREKPNATAIEEGAVTKIVPGGRYISLMA